MPESDFTMDSLDDLFTWKGLFLGLLVYIVTILASRRYFSPLSDIPGPFLASVTRLWHIATIVKGKQNIKILELHRKHGMRCHLTKSNIGYYDIFI